MPCNPPHPKEMKDKKLLIFDFDGTIVDSSPIHEQAFILALNDYQLHLEYEKVKGMRTKDALVKIFAQNNQVISDQGLMNLVRKKQLLSRNLFSNIILIDGFNKFFKKAQQIYQSCIVSSASMGSINLALNKFNLQEKFELILSAESVTNAKPDPEGFLHAITELNISKAETLIFEDSAAGFKAAENAGIDCIDITKTSWADMLDVIS